MTDAGMGVFKGLIEGLILLEIERSPTYGYAILKEYEDLLGQAPNKNQVYPLLSRMEEDGLIVSEEVTDDQRTRQVYRLTEAGQEHLDEFRALSAGFKHRLLELFALPPRRELARELEATGQLEGLEELEQAPRVRVRARPGEGWVPEAIERLPPGAEVKAPFAQVSMNREPGAGSWSLMVEHHRPGDYEGAEDCPLTFLYMAIQRLIFEPPGSG